MKYFMVLLNGVGKTVPKTDFRERSAAVMGHEENPLVAVEWGCLTTTLLGAWAICQSGEAEERRSIFSSS